MHKHNTFLELITIGHKLLLDEQFDKGLTLLSDHLSAMIGAQRCSIFIYDKKFNELWTILSTGIQKINVQFYQLLEMLSSLVAN